MDAFKMNRESGRTTRMIVAAPHWLKSKTDEIDHGAWGHEYEFVLRGIHEFDNGESGITNEC